MAKILESRRLTEDFFFLKAAQENDARMGQFYMLRAWDRYPMLSRPISVFDTDGQTLSFLYKAVGEGTQIFTRLTQGENIQLLGPNGTGFPEVSGKIALVGGGVGIAPMFLAAKQLKTNPDNHVDAFIGFSGKPVLTEEFERFADSVIVDVGGFITDKIDPSGYDHIFTCGPEIMMKVLYEKCKTAGVGKKLYVSVEERMGCGFGICVGCAVRVNTEGGFEYKKACSDGPVFRGEEVMV